MRKIPFKVPYTFERILDLVSVQSLRIALKKKTVMLCTSYVAVFRSQIN